MLERFTERARRAVVLATEEARSRRHETIGPEHLLMAGTSQSIPWSNLA